MASNKQQQAPACHIVSLDCHADGIVSLSLRAYGKWIYAEANPEWIKNDILKASFLELVHAYRSKQEDDQQDADPKVQELGVERSNVPQETTDKTENKKSAANDDGGRDSGYASDNSDSQDRTLFVGENDPQQRATQDPIDEQEKREEDGDDELRDFLLQSLDTVLSDVAAKHEPPKKTMLSAWYDTDLHFYTLGASEDEINLLKPIKRDDLDESKYIRKTLTPHIPLPKYLRKLSQIPWYSPKDIEVVSESDDLHLSIHPTICRLPTSSSPSDPEDKENHPTHTDCFLKLATELDEHAVKRELKFLHTLGKSDLYSKGIRAPRLAGLVSSPSSPNGHAQILGFLLTLIPQPAKPLTHYMDSSISQSKRNTWAKEAERMVQILHENDLVWGDAKADNFVVDKDGLLWMIDFGGSYTEGWIDEDLADTEEGDDMGTSKIVQGVRDPENSVANDEQEQRAAAKAPKTKTGSVHKRAREDEEEDEEKETSGRESNKKQKV